MLFSINDFTGLGLGKQPPVLRFGVGLDFWSLNRYGLGKRQSARVWLVIPPPSIIFIQLTLSRLASVRASRLEGDHLKEAPPHALHIPSPAVVGFTQRF